ncbi:MAG: alkaline shock response membrane anchor protein AmaP [Candidatus Omnitrophica bacterium]|nr:alkaline shock response membrane anchor protein AmaP [Candidatus Omnitrophota bacterium]
MRMLIQLAILFYLVVIFSVGFTALLVLAHVVDFNHYQDFLRFVYLDSQAGIIAAVIVAATMLIGLAFARIIYGRQEQERIIHFDNPLGRVSISLAALEDMIRRLSVHTPQVKEIRPEIKATKKGLSVHIRLVLRSDVNIPEMTADLQDIIKRKVQDLIGADEQVHIRVHVVKIVSEGIKERDEDEAISPLPFRGYRA